MVLLQDHLCFEEEMGVDLDLCMDFHVIRHRKRIRKSIHAFYLHWEQEYIFVLFLFGFVCTL